MSDFNSTTPVPVGNFEFFAGYVAIVAYYLVMWATAAAVVVGLVGMTFGVSFDSSLAIIIGFAVALMVWHTTPSETD